MSETTTINPVEHDVTLLDLYRAEAAADHALANWRGTLRGATDHRGYAERWRNGRSVPDPRPFNDVLEAVKAGIEKGASYDSKYAWPKYLERYAEAAKEAAAAREAREFHERAYTGWPRFWLVTSSPGHVHSTMACSSCNPRTTFALVPTLSGSTENEAVAMFGETMCSVCFPSAPTGFNIPKAVAEAVGTPGFAKALAKWKDREAEKVRKRAADEAAGKRKRPPKPRDVGWNYWLRKYPVEEGYY